MNFGEKCTHKTELNQKKMAVINSKQVRSPSHPRYHSLEPLCLSLQPVENLQLFQNEPLSGVLSQPHTTRWSVDERLQLPKTFTFSVFKNPCTINRKTKAPWQLLRLMPVSRAIPNGLSLGERDVVRRSGEIGKDGL